ncbi:hypothetical protein LLG96_04260 [bacterium]|nr:hypothetical protein [bacterium]
MTKHRTSIITLALLLTFSPVSATASFTADSNITVSAVTYGTTVVDMTILDGSTAESLTYDQGAFRVTNPDNFMVSCNDASVHGIRATLSGKTASCVRNSNPGTTYLALRNMTGEYTIEPITTDISHALTYNSSCGAASCETGYMVSGAGSSAVCITTPSGSAPGWMLQQPATEKHTVPADEAGIPPFDSQDISDKDAPDSGVENAWKRILSDGDITAIGDVDQLMCETGQKRDLEIEAKYNRTLVESIVKGVETSKETRYAITNFVTYGTQTTRILGAGERAGVVNSFKTAFGKLPTTDTDWQDVIKIANGRWPGRTNPETEKKVESAFRKIYLRNPDRTNPHDDAALVVMAYGLRPEQRNLESEKIAIGYFMSIYGSAPKSVFAWDVVRAIAYSGATR